MGTPSRRNMANSETHGHRRAFTLIEMVVVLVVIAILASIIVPRVIGNERRRFKLVADEVTDMLTMYAQRETLGQKAVGLQYNHERHWLVLMQVDVTGAEGSAPDWLPDPTVKPIKLPDNVSISDVLADGESVDISEWPLSTTPGQERPTIELVLTGPDGERAVFLLPPYAAGPTLLGLDSRAPAALSRIDLDSMGRSREDW